MAVRTFLALDLDEPIIEHLLRVADQLGDPDAKINWVAGQNIHLTLNFLGDVPDQMLPQVCDIAAAVAAAQIEPFEYEVRRVLVVPPHGPVRMLWADVIEPTGRLGELQDKLSAGLAGLGLRQEERDFRPHITLARIKFARNPGRLRAAAGKFGDEAFGAQWADELVAYASQLAPDGPIYTPIARAKIGA